MNRAAALGIATQATNRHGAMQRADELAGALIEVAALDPLRVIVEIGCKMGGTLFAWRQLGAEVYGITLRERAGFLIDHGADVHFGDSHAPESLAWLVEQLHGRPVDALHIDGAHSYRGVRWDYETYAPLVRPGGLVLLNDIAEAMDVTNEVPKFWAEIKGPGDREIVTTGPHPVGFGVITKGA